MERGVTCPHTSPVLVPIPEFLRAAGGIYHFDPSHPEYGVDEAGRPCLALDPCIVPAIEALWQAGVTTISSCCGHDDAQFGIITIDLHRRASSVSGQSE